MHHPRGGLLDDSHIPSPQNSPESKYFSVHSATKRCVAFFLVIFGLVGNSNSKQRKRKTRRDYGRVTEQDNLFFFAFVRAEPCRSQRQGVMQEPHAPARFARVRPCRYCHSDSTGRG